MKRFFLWLAVLMCYITAAEASSIKERPKPPLEVLLPIVTPLEPDAIRMGNGPVKVHVFVDPYCPRSRDFVTFVSSSPKMLERYSYYFYLYRLPRFDSEGLIFTIYNAPDKLAAMLDIMVNKKNRRSAITTMDTRDKIARVAAAAKKIDVYKRPYMIMVKEKKRKQRSE